MLLDNTLLKNIVNMGVFKKLISFLIYYADFITTFILICSWSVDEIDICE